MILDLTQTNSSARAKLIKLDPKRSGDDDNKLFCDLQIACRVENDDEAAVLARFAPGALSLFRASAAARAAAAVKTSTEGAAAGAEAAAVDGTFGDLLIRLPESSRNVRMGAKCDGGEFDLGPAEIRGALRFKNTPKGAVVTYKVRVHEVNGEEIGALAEDLDMLIDVTFKRDQTVLPFPNRTDEIEPKIGQVVSGVDGGEEYAGIVIGTVSDEDSGAMLEIDDCGTTKLVRVASVSGALTVHGPNESKLEKALAAYVKAAKKADVEPTWRHLVIALGQRYLADGDHAAWVLDGDVVSAAIGIAA